MASTKVKTVMVNGTSGSLILKVGNQNCFAKVATIAAGGQHKVEIDMNWTYQEFSLEPVKASMPKSKIVVNSDDCCDYEQITVTEFNGKLQVDKVARGQSNSTRQAVPSIIKDWWSYFTSWPTFKWRVWAL